MNERLSRLHGRLLSDGPFSRWERALFWLLKLLSLLFELVARGRVYCYRRGIFSSYRSRLPVISVGNLAVGGTGKTPVCDYLLKFAHDRGLQAAVISRGYGGNHTGPFGLVSDGTQIMMDATEAGDEPLLLAQRNPSALVVVARRRQDGIRYVEEHFSVDLLLLDDGFQHLQVARDLDLVLLDAANPFANGFTLPAGNLREPRSALMRADLILQTRFAARALAPERLPVPSQRCRYRLAEQLSSLGGEKLSLSQLKGFRPVLFAGLANPHAFFRSVEDRGVTPLACLDFADHASYGPAELRRIEAAVGGDRILLTTEKDAVKLTADKFSVPCYVAELEIDLEDPAQLEEMLLGVIQRKAETMNFNQDLLEVLACPQCKGAVSLERDAAQETIVCAACALAYPVRDGIPVMLIDEAQALGG